MSIVFEESTRTFYLEGSGMTYAFFVNKAGFLEHLYWGAPIPREPLFHIRVAGSGYATASRPGRDVIDDPYWSYQLCPPELCFFGLGDYREPTVQVVNPAGDRLCELLYTGHEILPAKPPIPGMPSLSGGETLVVHTADAVTGFAADLYYTVYEDCPALARRILYRNGGGEAISLRRAFSFALPLPGREYDTLCLPGAWGRERRAVRRPLGPGVLAVDSKRTSSSSSMNPFLGILSRGAGEETGEAWGFSLVYSSSFVLKAESTFDGITLITGGVQDFDFSWRLAPGEEFAAPEAVLVYSGEGLGGMSRGYHDAFRQHLIDPRRAWEPRPLVINNWEATYFNFDSDRLLAIADAAAGTGIDTFVLDDGWFGKRNDDTSGLGDWVVNGEKLKGGLGPLIDQIHQKGMKFGLWFEPEMVNEDSDLYRAHPDYAIAAPDRSPCYSRHQFILDLTRKEVRDCIVEAVNRILAAYPIDYVKWDYNRTVTESWSPALPTDRQGEFAHRYALGLYDLCQRIVKANPTVFFEGCAGGGARFDPAMLYYFPQIWTSDDTDGEERTHIQYGTSLVYPLSSMSCHVSVCPNHQTGRITPFATRGAVAALGAFGYELDSTRLTEEERKQIREQTALYRRDQQLILAGDLYRIDDPGRGNFFSEAVVAKDKSRALLVTYRRLNPCNGNPHRLRMRGLDPARRYRIEEMNLTLSGAVLMGVGLVPRYERTDFSALRLHFEAE